MSTTQELISQLRELEIDMVLDGNMRGVARNGADRLASLSAELDALRGKLAGVDEKALEVAHKALVPHVYLGRPDLAARAAIAAYLAAVRDR